MATLNMREMPARWGVVLLPEVRAVVSAEQSGAVQFFLITLEQQIL
jgi:hypothetical protein